MISSERSKDPATVETVWTSGDGVEGSFLRRLDLAAMFVVAACAGLLAMTAVVAAGIELVRLSSTLWSNPSLRWPFLVLGLAIVWLVARKKHL